MLAWVFTLILENHQMWEKSQNQQQVPTVVELGPNAQFTQAIAVQFNRGFRNSLSIRPSTQHYCFRGKCRRDGNWGQGDLGFRPPLLSQDPATWITQGQSLSLAFLTELVGMGWWRKEPNVPP